MFLQLRLKSVNLPKWQTNALHNSVGGTDQAWMSAIKMFWVETTFTRSPLRRGGNKHANSLIWCPHAKLYKLLFLPNCPTPIKEWNSSSFKNYSDECGAICNKPTWNTGSVNILITLRARVVYNNYYLLLKSDDEAVFKTKSTCKNVYGNNFPCFLWFAKCCRQITALLDSCSLLAIRIKIVQRYKRILYKWLCCVTGLP